MLGIGIRFPLRVGYRRSDYKIPVGPRNYLLIV